MAERRRRIVGLAAGLCAVALTAPGAASATTSPRTWVTGVGDDANPCLRTTPCQTFNAALAATSPGGEIDVLSPGEYGPAGNTQEPAGATTGPVSIAQSVTIDATAETAGVSPPTATDAIDIDAPGAVVKLIGLDIDGAGGPGLVGVNVIAAKQVWIENSLIYGFSVAGIEFAPSDSTSQLYVDGTRVENNGGAGILAASTGSDSVMLNGDSFNDNACGVVAASTGIQSGTPDFTQDCGTKTSGGGGSLKLSAINDTVDANAGTGVLANGGGAAVTLGSDAITGNATGLGEAGGGTITSLGALELSGNDINGAPTSTDVQAGATGPAGTTQGGTGATGANGASGAQGAKGPTGAAGKTELVKCVDSTHHKVTVENCTASLLVAGSTAPDHRVVQAFVTRGRRVFARGTATRAGSRVHLRLRWVRPHHAGRYTLILRRGRTVVARESIRIGASRV
jgi:hypothetical protein